MFFITVLNSILGYICVANILVNSQTFDRENKSLFNRNKPEKKDTESVKVIQGVKENIFEKMITSPENNLPAFNAFSPLPMYYSFVNKSFNLIISNNFIKIFIARTYLESISRFNIRRS